MPCSGCSAFHEVNPNEKKKKRIKRSFQEWFDREVLEKSIIQDKFSKNYKKSRLDLDKNT